MSAIASFWSCYTHSLPSVRIDYTPITYDYNKYYYKPTHTRCGPYLIGMICGYFIYNMKTSSDRKYNLSIFSKLLCWLTILTMLGICIFLPSQLSEDTVLENALFIPIHRIVWSTAVCSIIFLCETNNADFVNKFLSHPVFQVVARLSYCAYIVHPFIEFYRMVSLRTVFNFSRIQLIFDCWGSIVVSLFIAFFWSIMFEMPMPDVEKYVVEFVKRMFHGLFSKLSSMMKSSENKSI
ncbi:hypothetical protein JTB14_024978 [Gonioctena quinquepunctata]|nr:hypothetical protein JTB14_024978 [Gonioctena quinquepunctata]